METRKILLLRQHCLLVYVYVLRYACLWSMSVRLMWVFSLVEWVGGCYCTFYVKHIVQLTCSKMCYKIKLACLTKYKIFITSKHSYTVRLRRALWECRPPSRCFISWWCLRRLFCCMLSHRIISTLITTDWNYTKTHTYKWSLATDKPRRRFRLFPAQSDYTQCLHFLLQPVRFYHESCAAVKL